MAAWSIRSYSRPGESRVFIEIGEHVPRAQVDGYLYQIRKKVGDIRHTLPAEAIGPFFNDEFGDTFGNLFALTGEGFSAGAMKDWAERLRARLLRLPDVAKVDLLGVQDERIYIELSHAKRQPAHQPGAAARRCRRRCTVPSGFFEGGSDASTCAPAAFDSVQAIADMPIRAGDELFGSAMSPACAVAPSSRRRRACATWARMPSAWRYRWLKAATSCAWSRDWMPPPGLRQELPVGLELHRVADQPAAVRASIGEFLRVNLPGRVRGAAGELFPWACAPAWWWRSPFRWCWR